jgi:hypothetical protein
VEVGAELVLVGFSVVGQTGTAMGVCTTTMVCPLHGAYVMVLVQDPKYGIVVVVIAGLAIAIPGAARARNATRG